MQTPYSFGKLSLMSQRSISPHQFEPDLNATPEQNIELFWEHLAASNPDFTEMLKRGVQALTPLPRQDSSERTRKRKAFHKTVLQTLDSKPVVEKSIS